MDQLATVLEIIQDVKSLDMNQKANVMQYVKNMSALNNPSQESYRKSAIKEIRASFKRPSQF